MNESATNNIMTPVMQYGFAGLSAVLLGILVWLIRELLEVLKETNNVIAINTQAIKNVDGNSQAALKVGIEVKDELYKRPCIARIKIE